jgi:DNA-binding MarR family transcriptional regulator
MSSLSSPPPDPAPPAKTPPLNLTVRPRLIFGKSERFSVRLKSEIFVFAGLIQPFGKRRINVCATTVLEAMIAARQAVQRVANDLDAAGLTTYRKNPDHKRAKLVALTQQGELTYARADARQAAWVNAIGKGLNPARVAAAARLLRTIHDRCREKAGNDAHSNGE